MSFGSVHHRIGLNIRHRRYMIEQKDIDRLLAGRKIIDSIETIDVSKLQDEYSKISKDEIKDLTKDEVREIKDKIDKFYFDEALGINNAIKQLLEIGFTGIDDFLQYNYRMCLSEQKERLEITRVSCNGCPTKRCVELYKTSACFYQTSGTVSDNIFDLFTRLRKKSLDNEFSDVKVCPDGYGFHWKELREPQFDLGWRK